MTTSKPFRLRIRTVLLLVNLVILVLPLFGIQALRLYENELVRQTEAALIAQGTYVREHFRERLVERLRSDPAAGAAAKGVDPLATYGLPVLPAFHPGSDQGEGYDPVQPSIEVGRHRQRQRAEDATTPDIAPDAAALEAGRALSPLLRRTLRYALIGVRVVDFRGTVVASTRGELGMSLLAREEVARALGGEAVSLLRDRISDEAPPPVAGLSRRAAIRVFLALPVTHGDRVLGAVVLSRTPMDIQKALYLNRFVLLRYTGGIVLIVLLVSVLTATTISRPIRALITQAKAVKEDPTRATSPLPAPGSREIAELSEAVAEMARTLQVRADYIHTFARSVSHEFKTPLGGILGVTELLKDHFRTMSDEERAKFLGLIERDATRMRRLVDRLLALARAEVAEPAAEWTDPAAILRQVVERRGGAGAGIRLNPPEPGTGPLGPVRMAGETLETLIDNLLDNARQHGGKDAAIAIDLTPATAADGRPQVRIAVRDYGKGISTANLARVFDPFFTTGREHGGTGLGLSIVRALVDTHGGSIGISQADPGTVVVLTLPVDLSVDSAPTPSDA